jgi:hypothetical protein
MTPEEQKKLLVEIMDADAKDGLYDEPKTSIDWLIDQLINVERPNHINKRMLPISKNSLKEKAFKALVHQAKMMYNQEMMNEFGRGYDEGSYDRMYK